MVEADAVEAVFQGEDALDFVGLDHRGEDVTHGEGAGGGDAPARLGTARLAVSEGGG